MITLRLRSMTWFASGVAIACILTAVFVGIRATAAPGDEESVFIPTTPCRLFDTRTAPNNVGPRNTPLGADETHLQQITGAVGNCALPAGATAVAMNVTIVNGTVDSFLQVWPGDEPKPVQGSSLNWISGQPPTPNKVDVKLSATGAVNIYNLAGNVDVLADSVGYYVPASQRTSTHSVSFPAQALNIFPGAAITRDGGGLVWQNVENRAAFLSIHRPDDWTGTGEVTLEIWYLRENSDPGNVQFFARPRDYNNGDSFLDAPSVTGDVQGIAGTQNQVVTIDFAASSLTKDLWDIVIQRNADPASPYPGDVTVRSVKVSYQGFD